VSASVAATWSSSLLSVSTIASISPRLAAGGAEIPVPGLISQL
jgi:hypothetical protein